MLQRKTRGNLHKGLSCLCCLRIRLKSITTSGRLWTRWASGSFIHSWGSLQDTVFVPFTVFKTGFVLLSCLVFEGGDAVATGTKTAAAGESSKKSKLQEAMSLFHWYDKGGKRIIIFYHVTFPISHQWCNQFLPSFQVWKRESSCRNQMLLTSLRNGGKEPPNPDMNSMVRLSKQCFWKAWI